MMPTVFFVMSASMRDTSMLNVARSMSQNTGVAPMCSTTFGVATQVLRKSMPRAISSNRNNTA